MLSGIRREASLRALHQLGMNLLTVQYWLVIPLTLLVFLLVFLFALLLNAHLDLTRRVQPQWHAKLGLVLRAREHFID